MLVHQALLHLLPRVIHQPAYALSCLKTRHRVQIEDHPASLRYSRRRQPPQCWHLWTEALNRSLRTRCYHPNPRKGAKKTMEMASSCMVPPACCTISRQERSWPTDRGKGARSARHQKMPSEIDSFHTLPLEDRKKWPYTHPRVSHPRSTLTGYPWTRLCTYWICTGTASICHISSPIGQPLWIVSSIMDHTSINYS